MNSFMKHDAGRNEKRPSVNHPGTYSRSAQPQEQSNYRSCDLRCQQFYLKNKTILAADAGIIRPFLKIAYKKTDPLPLNLLHFLNTHQKLPLQQCKGKAL